jgi:acyl carrier protein
MTQLNTRVEIESKVTAIVCEDLGIDPGKGTISAETPLDELAGIDSTALLQLLMAIEEEFGIEIDESEVTLDDLKDVRSISSLVERGLSA